MAVTITIREDLHQELMDIRSDSENFDDILEKLLIIYENYEFGDFCDKQAAFYNECYEKFENGDREGTHEVDINAILSELGSE